MKKCLAVARNREVVTCAGHVRLLNTRDVPSRRSRERFRSLVRSAALQKTAKAVERIRRALVSTGKSRGKKSEAEGEADRW